MTVKLSKVRNNLLQEMKPRQDCIVSKNTCFHQIFMGTGKKSKETFQWQKNMEDARLIVFKFFFFVFVCVIVFLNSIFLFQRAFYYLIGRYFFVEAHPFKNICQMEIFVIVYLPKESLLNKQSLSLCEASQPLRILKKNMLFKLNAVFG